MMFVFAVVNLLLVLNFGFVQNAPHIKKCASKSEQCQEASESSYREVETGCGSVTESSSSSVKQASSYSASSEFMSSSDCSDEEFSFLKEILEQCSYISDKEYYYEQLRRCKHSHLKHIKPIIDHLKCNKPCLGDLKDFAKYQQQFRSVYEILKSNKIFSPNCDISKKRKIIEEARCKLREILSCVPKKCFLHKPLKFICEDDLEMFPIICGLTNSLLESQSTYYSQQSSSSTSTRSVSSSSTNVSQSTSEIDISSFKSILEQCSYIQDKNWYYEQLKHCKKDHLPYIKPIIESLNCKKGCLDDLKDFIKYQQQIRSIYDILKSNQIFSSNCDLSKKAKIIEEAKCKLKEMLSCFPKNCFLHKPLSCICDGNLEMFPIICGLTNSLFESQSTYYSQQSSSSTSTRSVSSSSTNVSQSTSEIDISSFKSILEQCSYIQDKNWYYEQLKHCKKDHLPYIKPIIESLNCKKGCLDDLKDFIKYQQQFRSIYDILKSNQIFSSNCDLSKKAKIIEEAKCKLKEMLSCFPKNCFLHKPLSCICDGNLEMFPIICGLTNSLFESQCSYYSSSSSSHSSSSSTSCGSVSQSESCSKQTSCVQSGCETGCAC